MTPTLGSGNEFGVELEGLPRKRPVPIIIPTTHYPHLRKIVTELRLYCPGCSKAFERRIWYPFLKLDLEPTSGPAIPGRASISKNGMIATRFACLCPRCGDPVQPSDNGVVDLLAFPKDFKPAKPEDVPNEGGVRFDNEVEQESETETETPKRGRGRNKKVTDVSEAAKAGVRAARESKAELEKRKAELKKNKALLKKAEKILKSDGQPAQVAA